MKKILNYLIPVSFVALISCKAGVPTPIDRQALVERNSPQITAFF